MGVVPVAVPPVAVVVSEEGELREGLQVDEGPQGVSIVLYQGFRSHLADLIPDV